MEDVSIIEILKAYFGMEILNEAWFGNNEIVVKLSDGTRAKITAK